MSLGDDLGSLFLHMWDLRTQVWFEDFQAADLVALGSYTRRELLPDGLVFSPGI